jgi:hypothetical protein
MFHHRVADSLPLLANVVNHNFEAWTRPQVSPPTAEAVLQQGDAYRREAETL